MQQSDSIKSAYNHDGTISMTSEKYNLDFKFAEHSLALACLRGREAVVSNFAPLLQELDVTEQQWRVMRIAYEYEELPFAELCKLCCIHKVSMARIVSFLSERGWIEKRKSEIDLRAYTVLLTETGRDITGKAVAKAQVVHGDIFARYGQKKAELLLELLKDLDKIRRSV